MHRSAFDIVETTVIETQPREDGLEYWVREEGGRERSYYVYDRDFAARAGHRLTEVQFQRRPVLIRNNATQRKIALLAGEDLLGSGPAVRSRSVGFWVCGIILLGPVLGLAMWLESYGKFYHPHGILSFVAIFASEVVAIGYVFVLPLGVIFWPRVKWFHHHRLIKAANATITEIYKEM